MSDTLLALLPMLGLPALALVVGLGALGVPMMPASLMVLVAGTLVAAEELPLTATAATCLVTAIAADNAGFMIGRTVRARTSSKRSAAMDHAQDYLDKRGASAVFFTRWLLAPLGPPLNIVAGASGMCWRRFAAWDIAGEIVWVGGYLTLGAAFAPFIPEIAELTGNVTWALACLVIAALALRVLRRQARRHRS